MTACRCNDGGGVACPVHQPELAGLDDGYSYHIQGRSYPYRDPPAQQHSETSRAAALAALPRAGTERARVLAYLQKCGPTGATDDQIQIWLEMNPSTERPRRIELWKGGLIRMTDRKRKTRAGRPATVWVAV